MTLLPLSLLVLASAPQVSSVVVHPDHAQVTRTSVVTCRGATTAVFEHLPADISRASFQARASGATLEGLSAEFRPLDKEAVSEREKWEARELALRQEEAAQEAAAAQATELERLAQGYTDVAVAQVSREMTGARPDTRTWGSAFDAAWAVRLRGVREKSALAAKQRDLQRRRDEIEMELARLKARDVSGEHRVEVRLSCPEGTQSRVELSYLVAGASWTPVHEARADEAGGVVHLTSLATVRQVTGEDWTGAKLFVSTARPGQDATPPEFAPLLVTATQRPRERKVLAPTLESQNHVATSASARLSQGDGLEVLSQGVSVQWEVKDPTRVLGDGTEVRVLLGRHRLPAEFSWRTVPKLRPVVFRVARLANTTPFPLLPGKVSVFSDKAFLGNQSLERVEQGMPFELTFGLEEALRVKRSTVGEEVQSKGLFGGKQRFRYVYRFELMNLRTKAETVLLSEHIPVSELDDVKVEVEPTTTAGFTVGTEDGIAVWKLALAPGEKRTVELAFHVDAPSSYSTLGM
ncbi:mucoidy inhibitor MuiA family protein [Myxococcus stipitatus]|uniref:mucoidy inhibitor MuiA family protein n=1 Tax=Myxococcus stipitatus TaxID=83455 RepID=UPI0031450688